MSKFLHHAPCPNCGSRDNLGVYSDHTYCFGCHNYVNTDVSGSQSKRFPVLEDVNNHSTGTYLPNDSSDDIDYNALQWLKKYGITGNEIIHNKLLWSQNGIHLKKKDILCTDLLIFPIRDQYGNLIMWTARNFGGNPKWIHMGNVADTLHIIPKIYGDKIVLVEDIISAIKIGRHACTMPLFGNHLSKEMATRLHKLGFSDIIFWLDHNMIRDAHLQAKRASQLFERTRVIETELDPKSYSDFDAVLILKKATD